jgi:hypothetical protein
MLGGSCVLIEPVFEAFAKLTVAFSEERQPKALEVRFESLRETLRIEYDAAVHVCSR